MAPRHKFEYDLKLDAEARVREGVRVVLEEILKVEITEHLKAGATGSCPR